MTHEDTAIAVQDAFTASLNIVGHLERLRGRMNGNFPLSADMMDGWSDPQFEQLHTFLHLFEQLQEMIGRLLFRGTMILLSEDADALSARNLYRRLEKLGAIESAEEWIDLGKVRNRLVHEYPTNSARQVSRANMAWENYERLIAVHRQLSKFLISERLVETPN